MNHFAGYTFFSKELTYLWPVNVQPPELMLKNGTIDVDIDVQLMLITITYQQQLIW
jgi:hypothetical protein